MELRQIKYFLAVAEELHFGQAAKRLNISQPPLSQQIRQLEDELEAKLFTRTSRMVKLTPEGEFYQKEMKVILRQIEKTSDTVKLMAKGEAGRLTIGFVGAVNQSRLPEVVREFRQKSPNVNVQLKEMNTNHQIQALSGGNIDIGFLGKYGHQLKGLSKKIFLQESYLMALPENHPLAAEKEVKLSDLKDDALIIFTRDYQPKLYDSILKRFEEAGVRPKMIQETHRHLTSIALVAAGMGVAPIWSSMNILKREGVVYLPIADEFPLIEIVAAWKEDNYSTILKNFIEVMGNYCLKG